MERKATIKNFEQEEVGSFFDTWERFKLLLHKCPNYNMSAKEKLTHFIGGIKVQMSFSTPQLEIPSVQRHIKS